MKMQQTSAIIILAAGNSTRMRSATSKIFQPLAGLSLLGHVIHNCQNAGYDALHIVINSNIDQQKINAPNAQLHIQENALGTADAVKSAQFNYGDYDDIAIIFGDSPFIDGDILRDMREKLHHHGDDAVILGFHHHDNHPYGRLLIDGDYLVKIIEYKDCDAPLKSSSLCNSGVMLVKGKILAQYLPRITNDNAAREYYLTDLPDIITQHQGKCRYLLCDETQALGIDNAPALAKAHQIIFNQYRQYWLGQGVRMIDPQSVYFAYDTHIGDDCLLEPHIYFGTGVTIGNGNIIKSFSHIEGASIGDNCEIGPFARLRPGVACDGDNRIGNFVEAKNTRLHHGVKAGHLSYLGDSDIGKNSNIGAGTITCNYDGQEKHKTKIGDNVFIGSNSALIAPLTIGDGAVIGAGSAISNDVADDMIAYRQSPQIEKPKQK